MKHLSKLIAVLALLATPLAASAVTGDVNGDGFADIDDVNMIINEMLGRQTGLDCDANHDGNVDVDDLNLVINVLLGVVPQGVTPEDETFTVEGVEFKMIYVEGGTFTMGGRNGIFDLPDYEPYLSSRFFVEYEIAHDVTLTSYKIMETETVQALYHALMGEQGKLTRDDFYSDNEYNNYVNWLDPAKPEAFCSWPQAEEFARRLSAATGRSFRLPTEAEWEYAARGGKKSLGYVFPGGNNLYAVGNVHTTDSYLNSPKAPKSYLPNELGIYDMAGNVAEWCSDEYYLYTEDPQTDPEHGGGALGYDPGYYNYDYRVVRGGHCSTFPYAHCRCTVSGRFRDTKSDTYHGQGQGYGVRLVLTD